MSKVKYNTSAQHEWNERTSIIQPHAYKEPFFHDLLQGIIPDGAGKTCIELGALPGNYLAYFNKEYNYSITGLDFSTHSKVFFDTMKINKINDFNFIKANILSYKSPKKYDLVCSFGLIEHFDDINGILKKHVELLSEDASLLVTVPNFRYLQWLYHRVFDSENLSIHNIDAMRSKKIDKILTGLGLTKIINEPVGKVEFWYEDATNSRLFSKFRYVVTILLNKLFKKTNNKSNYFSPILIYVYKRQ